MLYHYLHVADREDDQGFGVEKWLCNILGEYLGEPKYMLNTINGRNKRVFRKKCIVLPVCFNFKNQKHPARGVFDVYV